MRIAICDDELKMRELLVAKVRRYCPEAARAFRQKNKSAVLIFITALAEYVFQAFDVGAFHYLVKPFSDEKFAEVLGAAQVQSRRTAALPVREEKYNFLFSYWEKAYEHDFKVYIEDVHSAYPWLLLCYHTLKEAGKDDTKTEEAKQTYEHVDVRL